MATGAHSAATAEPRSRSRSAWDLVALIVIAVGVVITGVLGCWVLVVLGSPIPRSSRPRTNGEWLAWWIGVVAFGWVSNRILGAWRQASHSVRRRIVRRWPQAASDSIADSTRALSIVATGPLAGLLLVAVLLLWQSTWLLLTR